MSTATEVAAKATRQSAFPPCVLHARFEGARLVWSLRRDGKELGAGKLSPLAVDPLAELRRIEVRAGATVVLTNSHLSPDELTYAAQCGWKVA